MSDTELVANPFGTHAVFAETAGARQSQSREVAEMQTKYLMAQQFPRDERASMDKILNAFTRPSLAEKAQYQYARGGTDIVGPSIRSAETIAQCWGNMEFGFREVARNIGHDGIPFSEVEAFALDVEGRTRRPLGFFVKHWRDTKGGGYKLKEERDIYELMSNQAQRRVRACILALVPGDVVEAAMRQADMTLKATADTSPEAMQKMVAAFEPFGVTKEHIEKRIQRRLDSIQPAQVVALKRIYASLRDDMSEPSDWFEVEKKAAAGANVTLDELKKKGEKVDPATGEIKPPTRSARAKPAAAAPPATPASEQTTHSVTYAQLVDQLQSAGQDEDLRALVLDRARALPADQLADFLKLAGVDEGQDGAA